MKDPTLNEMRQFCNKILEETFFPIDEYEFDREEAIYWFAANYHGGQSSNLYLALCESHFKPSPLSNSPGSWFSRDLYDSLVEEFGK